MNVRANETSVNGEPIIRLEDVSVVDHSGNVMLDHINLEVAAGRTLGLAGPSGAGKTTLTRLLIGDLPDGCTLTGTVTVADTDVFALDPRARQRFRRTRLGVVHQHPASSLNPAQRVGSAAVELLPRRSRWPELAATLLTQVGLPADEAFLRRRTHQLSGGQRQRLAIARALAHRPDVVVLDEPTAELDTDTRDLVLDLLATHLQHATTVVVAHDLHVIERLADRVAHLDQGRLVTPRQRSSMAAMRDRLRVSRPGDTMPPVLAVRELAASHRGVGRRHVVFDGLQFDVHAGRGLAVVGASGVGKTTLARCITGLHVPDAGTVGFGGHTVAPDVGDRTLSQRRTVQLVPQDPSSTLPPGRRIVDIVARPAIRFGLTPRREARDVAAALLDRVGIRPALHRRRTHELSGGERQRVAIARALAAEPEILVCDEITSALDSANAALIVELLAEVRDHRQLALVVVTHDPLVAAELGDDLLELQTESERASSRRVR